MYPKIQSYEDNEDGKTRGDTEEYNANPTINFIALTLLPLVHGSNPGVSVVYLV